MTKQQEPAIWSITVLIGVLTFISACSHEVMHDAAYQKGKSSELLNLVEQGDSKYKSVPSESVRMYQEVLSQTKIRKKFPDHHKVLVSELEIIQAQIIAPSLSDEAGLGFPENYARATLAAATAHLGMAKVHLSNKALGSAIKEAEDANALIGDCNYCPHTVSRTLLESNKLLMECHQAQGAVGKALIHKLKVELLEDHLASEMGLEEFFLEKQAIFGEGARKQYAAVDSMFAGVRTYHRKQQQANMMAVVGGLTALNASLQPTSAFAQSQMQMMNIAASMAARAETKTVSIKGTPWALPTFTQKLVDPRQGANTPAIVKGFASDAARVGGTSYQAGAQQITHAVDSLAPYRESAKAEGAAAQVEQFAEVFNAFIVQVEGIKK